MRLVQILKGYFVAKYATSFSTREQLERYQQKKIKKHLKFLKKKSPYFREHLKNENTFFDLPYMNKEIMMEHFNEMNTENIKKEEAFQVAFRAEETRDFSPKIGNITIGLSSGTSGNRGLFLVSENESNEWAGTILAKLLPNGLKQKEKIAFFLRANSNLYESVGSNRIQFQFFDLLDDISLHIERLNAFQPTIVAAPPSMMRILAEKKKENNLHIQPRRIITMAEVLDPLDETFIKEVFNQNVFQVYQCTEGFLGVSCSHGTLHLNEDIVFIEKEFIDDEQSKFYPIITDFRRKTQPIVRYKLNDVLTLKSTPCPCGSTMTALEQIEGRSDDIFTFSHESKEDRIVIFPDFIRKCIMISSSNIKEYRVIQINDEELQIMLKKIDERHETEKEVENALRTFFTSKNVKMPKITFIPYVAPPKGVKLRRVEVKKCEG